MEKVRKKLNFRGRPKPTRSVGYAPTYIRNIQTGKNKKKSLLKVDHSLVSRLPLAWGWRPRLLPRIESSGLNLHESVGLKRYATPAFSAAQLLPWPDCMGFFPEIV